MWLEEYHLEGLRFDGTGYIRTVDGPGSADLPDGWSLLQAMNSLVTQDFPGRITIAEDLQNNRQITQDVGAGGAGFGSQWDSSFVHPIRQAVIASHDEQRSLATVRNALDYRYNDDAFDRVIYSELHDENVHPTPNSVQQMAHGHSNGRPLCRVKPGGRADDRCVARLLCYE